MILAIYVTMLIISVYGAFITKDGIRDSLLYIVFGITPGLNIISVVSVINELVEHYEFKWRDDEDIDQPKK